LTKKDCRFIEDSLEDVLAGRLTPDMQASLDKHLAKCATCRQLLEIVQGTTNLFSMDSCQELTQAILGQTSGLGCRRARIQLPDWVDQQLTAEDAELLQEHLRHCVACRALTEVLVELRTDLPKLAEIEPDSDFAMAVLAATLGRNQPVRPWLDSVQAWWQKLFQRPRIAWEAAYLGTLLVLGIFLTTPIPKVVKESARLRVTSVEPLAYCVSVTRDFCSQASHRLGIPTTLAESAAFGYSLSKEFASASVDQLRLDASRAWNGGVLLVSGSARWAYEKSSQELEKARAWGRRADRTSSS
jgi:anti-sigma factor RsiW